MLDPTTGMPTLGRRTRAGAPPPPYGHGGYVPPPPGSQIPTSGGDGPAPTPFKVPLLTLHSIAGLGSSPYGSTIMNAVNNGTLPGIGSPGAAAGANDLTLQIENDPLYKQLKAELDAEHASDLASRAAARQRAIALFGEVPDFGAYAGAAGDGLGGDITDTIRKLAADNTKAGLSTIARINQADQDVRQQVTNSLAARGILSSGETGYQLGREDTAYRQTQFDARQQLLDYLSGIQGGYLSAERQRSQTLSQGASDAAGRLQYAPPGAPPSGSPIIDAINNGTIQKPDWSGPPTQGVPTFATAADPATIAREQAARRRALAALGYHTAGL